MALGATALEAVRIVVGSVAHITFRQLLAVDAAGRTAVFSGSKTLGTYAAVEAEGAAAAGNMLRSKAVPERMLFCLRRLDWSPRRATAGRNACRSRCRRRGRASAFVRPAHRT